MARWVLVISAVGLVGCGSDRAITPEPACESLDSVFADTVLRYDPTIAGGPVPGNTNFDEPEEALGEPDYSGGGTGTGSVSLSLAGVLEVGFERCWGQSSGDERPDLVVHEIGPKPENFVVAVSTPDALELEPSLEVEDGYYFVDHVIDHDRGIDVDGPLELDAPIHIDRVMVIDDPLDSTHGHIAPGADIDAVELYAPVTPD